MKNTYQELELNDGTKVKLKNFMAFAEKVVNKW